MASIMAQILSSPVAWRSPFQDQAPAHDGYLAAGLQGQGKAYWLPEPHVVKNWLTEKIEQLDAVDGEVALHPSLVALRDHVEKDSFLRMLSREMLREVPVTPPYDNDPRGVPQIRDFDHFLHVINLAMKEGPQFYHVDDPPTAMELVGLPISAALNWPMGTTSGYHFFLDKVVNKHFGDILNTWAKYLESPDSQECLTKAGGWLSQSSLNMLTTAGNNGATTYSFGELYECDTSKQGYGFSCWDAFFTREFRPGVRPVQAADDQLPTAQFPDPTSVIVNSCESMPLQFASDVKSTDIFWAKGQPYSLIHMLNNSQYAARFAGGSVYQAYLSAISYHRWHAPVSGVIREIQNVPGTYFSQNFWQGFANTEQGPDPSAQCRSQPYLASVAARGLIFIEADNADIGLMAVVYIGMGEVSSCEFTVKEGDRVRKGQQIGMFHYGGSSHCMVFRPETKLSLFEPEDRNVNRAVNSIFATAIPSTAGDGESFVVL